MNYCGIDLHSNNCLIVVIDDPIRCCLRSVFQIIWQGY
jgi:hypothetical protein